MWIEKIDCMKDGSALYTIFVVIVALSWCGLALGTETTNLDESKRGRLLMKTTNVGEFIEVPLQSTEVKITVMGVIARTHLTQKFVNSSDAWVEAVYAFPLPEGAAVDHMRMKIGERLIEGLIKEKNEAKRIFQEAAREGKKAALVEQHRPNLFTTSVANIPPQAEVEVMIEYQQLLQWRDDQFSLTFPMAITPRFEPGSDGTISQVQQVGKWGVMSDELNTSLNLLPPDKALDAPPLNPVSLEVELNSGFPLAELKSRYHAIDELPLSDNNVFITLKDEAVAADRDFVLQWRPKASHAPSAAFFTEHNEQGDFGLLMVMPPQTAFKAKNKSNREVIFIIDTSGSMGGESIKQAQKALTMGLKRLQPNDRFNVIEFNSHTVTLFKQSKIASVNNIQVALDYVRNLVADGGTNMLPALSAAFNMPVRQDGYAQQVVFMTDGAVTNEKELLLLIHASLAKRSLFTVAIGSAPNHYFMQEAANFGRGSFTHIGRIDEVSEKMQALFARLDHPALTDIRLELPVAADILPNPLPDLYQGEPVIALMRLHAGVDRATLTGNIGSLQWKNSLSLQSSEDQQGLGVQWARAEIQRWMRLQAKGEDEAKVKAHILPLALDHHLVSQFTSLVAVDITPAKPQEEELLKKRVKNNLPAGLNMIAQPVNRIVMARGATSFQAWLALGLALMLLSSVMRRVTFQRKVSECS